MIQKLDRYGAILVCALVFAGVAMLAMLGAPMRVWAVNLFALPVAVLAYLAAKAVAVRANASVAAAFVVCSLLAVAVFAPSVDGVRRWIGIGPVSLHVGFVLLPIFIAMITRIGGWLPAIMTLALGYALWLQPDGGSAMGVSCAVLGLAIATRSVRDIVVAIVASGWCVVTWFKFDPLQPVAYVEGALEMAMAQHPILGVLAFALLIALSAPFFWLGYAQPSRRAALWALGGFWLGAVIASFVGAFPSPILGSGAGPIIGYALSWAILIRRDVQSSRQGKDRRDSVDELG